MNKKEILIIIISIIVLGFIIALSKDLEDFSTNLLYGFLFVFIILLVNILAKKLIAYYLDSEIEIKLWEIQRFGYRAHWKFKKPIPAGVIFPIIFAVISTGYIKWLATLVFDVKASVHRAARRYGIYSFSEITEYHMALIAGAGIIMNLIVAVIAYLLGYEEFTRLSIYFVFFNMLPISDLDGNKIFFGSLIFWSFLAAISLIAMGYALFLI